jgi:hypothetical protein
VPFAVLAPGGQSGKFWIHPRTDINAATTKQEQHTNKMTTNTFSKYCEDKTK